MHSIAALARAYEAKAKKTKLDRQAKGLATADDEDGFEVQQVNETIKAQEPLELLPQGFNASKAANLKLDSTFRAERIEFVLMCKPINPQKPADLDWSIPDAEIFDKVLPEVMAVFIEKDPTKADDISWSSVTQITGIGMFAMWAHKVELISSELCYAP